MILIGSFLGKYILLLLLENFRIITAKYIGRMILCYICYCHQRAKLID